jgi:hypothetical protein
MSAARPIHHALAEALGVTDEAELRLETVDVAGAAALLHTSERAIYVRRQRGQMPTPLPGRRLVWRKIDLLKLR